MTGRDTAQAWRTEIDTSLVAVLAHADEHGYALGAFNVYDFEGGRAVTDAAEQASSPVLLQVHPRALRSGGVSLLVMCLESASRASVPGLLTGPEPVP